MEKKKKITLKGDKSIFVETNQGVININTHKPLLNVSLLLKQGSDKYYRELKGHSGRFKYLNISEILLSGVRNTFLATTLKRDEKECSLNESLQQLWSEACKHCVLVGEGGMGKTVSLVRLWEYYLNGKSENSPVPIYIPLNEYNNASEKEQTDFIASFITRHYLERKHLSVDEENQLWQFLENDETTNHPGIILLLDGFNEITVDKTLLLLSIKKEWKTKAKQVQLVISSRYDMRSVNNWNDFHHFLIQPLSEEKVKNYLGQFGIVLPDNQKLKKLFFNPMMLTIYAASCEITEKYRGQKDFQVKKEVSSYGELMWNFMEAQCAKYFEQFEGDEKNYSWFHFMLKHFIPYIGYEMEKKGKYDFSDQELNEVMEAGCKYFYTGSFAKAFPRYKKNIGSFNLEAKDFPYDEERIENLKNLVCKELLMLVEEDKSFRFLHQNFRDYYSSVHILNEMERTIFEEQLSDILKDRILPVYIRRNIGEIEGEHHHQPKLIKEEKRWSIDHYTNTRLNKGLNLCRRIFDSEKIGYITWNIITIWMECREDLSGADLSELDLSEVGFNNIRCSKKYGDHYLAASFNSSKICIKKIFHQGHTKDVVSVAYSSDGKKIISGSWDKTIKEWSVETSECLNTFTGHIDWVLSVAYSPDGKKVISNDQSTIKEWSVETGECLNTFTGHSNIIYSAAYSRDGKKIISSDRETIKEWSVETGECVNTFKGYHGVYSVDGEKIISSSGDKTIKEWSVETGECLNTFTVSGIIEGFAYSPDEKKIISTDQSTIKEWSVENGKCLNTYTGHGKNYFSVNNLVSSVAYSPDGKKIISGSGDHTVKEWLVETGECLNTFIGHSQKVASVGYSPDGKKIISGSSDNTIKEWSPEIGECLNTYTGRSNSITSAYCSLDGKKIILGSKDYSIQEWSLEVGECLNTFIGHSDQVCSVAYSSDGKKIISGSFDRTIKEWSVETGECLNTFITEHIFDINVAYSPDAEKIISGSWDRTIKEWSVKTGKCLNTFRGHTSTVRSVTYSPDGKKIISFDNSTIKEWSVETGECLNTFEESKFIISVAYNPDGKKIIISSDENTIKERSLETGQCLNTFKGYHGTYSLDGKKIMSSSRDKTIKEWSAETGECLNTFTVSGIIKGFAYSPDGKKIVSSPADNTIKEWSLETGECIKTMNPVVGLMIQGCTFKNLHPDSQFSKKEKEILKKYKAVFD